MPNVRFVAASALLGVPLQVNLDTGKNPDGSDGTDYGPKLSTFLSSATAASPVVLIMDGAVVSSGIFGAAGGYWTIQGFGNFTGFYQKSGANEDVIHNGGAHAGNPFDPGSGGLPSWLQTTPQAFLNLPIPARGKNVRISNIRINGNRGDGHTGNSTTGDTRGLSMTSSSTDWWYVGVNLMNLDHITVEDVWFTNMSAYCIRLSNVGHVRVRGVDFEPETSPFQNNTDGLHINGNANDIHIDGCYFNTGDDSIALNSAEGYAGPIVRVAVTNCTFGSASTFMRLYSNSIQTGTDQQVGVVDGVTVSNCSGGAYHVGFLFGIESPYTRHNVETIRNVSISNCNFYSPYLALVDDNIGALSFDNVNWMIADPTTDNGTAVRSDLGTPSFIQFAFDGCSVSSLNLRGCRIQRTSRYSSTYGMSQLAFIHMGGGFYGGGTGGTHYIKQLLISDCAVHDPYDTFISAMPWLIKADAGSTIGRLTLGMNDTGNIGALGDSGTLAAIGVTKGTF